MKEIILLSNCYEKAEIGYVSTFIDLNRATNEVNFVRYYWHENISTDDSKCFDSFESLNAFIDELLNTKNETK